MVNQKRVSQPRFLNKKGGSLSLLVLFLATASIILLGTETHRTLANTFDAPPSLVAVSPTQSFNWQETTISITGTDFVPSTTVAIGNILLTPVNIVNSSTLTSIVPASLPSGAYTLTVTNPDGQSASLSNAYTVLVSGNGDLGTWQTTASLITPRNHPAAASHSHRRAGAGRHAHARSCRHAAAGAADQRVDGQSEGSPRR